MAKTFINRRDFLQAAAAMGATLAWSRGSYAAAQKWTPRPDLYPDGVASGDPDDGSVILWTRRAFQDRNRSMLTAEVALDPDFTRVVASVRAPVSAKADWTCRILAAGLRPATVYWYRFIDETGAGSRIGRTLTAPSPTDPRPVRFAFVSCQSVNEGAQNAYRRMIFEDERAAADRQLAFVLHLGDFIYEVVEYPDEVSHRYDRTVFDIGRVPDARKIRNFHVPTTLEGYRTVYRAHIRDPDIQDARARFPFICIGDNHEFSWQGWQSFIKFEGKVEPAQALRVAANQAWWEYIPSRARKASGPDLETFSPPRVESRPIERFDDHGFGEEPNNRAAVGSMTAYRSLRYGRNADLLITDMHSFMMESPTDRPEAAAFQDDVFPYFFPQEVAEILDAGREFAQGQAPDTIAFGDRRIANFRKNEPAFTLLGREQKQWFKETLLSSKATWKIWAASNGTLDWRADPQNLPEGLTSAWPGAGYASFGSGDLSGAYRERAELYDLVRDRKVEGFVTVSGDRHSFWAGYAAKALPPAPFEPIGLSFITGSISAPGLVEAVEHVFPKDHPLRPLYLADRKDAKPEATINLTLKRGVRSALEYARSGDIEKARALTNPSLSPHLTFLDLGGHGYSVVTAASDFIETEFVCIPRPIARSTEPNGGPLRYRVVHRAKRWNAGERPHLEQSVLEGNADLSL